jgi:hypothetical protein
MNFNGTFLEGMAQSALIARNARLWQNSREKRHD